MEIGSERQEWKNIGVRPRMRLKAKTLVRHVVEPCPSYLTLHCLRKHLMWLVKAHEARNTCEVHLASTSMQDFAKLVSDQSDSLSELAGQNVGVISSLVGVEPLLLSCLVCRQSTGGLDGRPP